MTFVFITLPIVICAWIFYSSRSAILWFGRWVLHRRYSVSLSGIDCIDPTKTYLIIPNHPAIVDPLIVVAELHRLRIDVRPLVDESFFSNALVSHILELFEAVRVPDFRQLNFRPVLKVRPKVKDAAKRAKSLGYTVLSTLTRGGNVLLYPSGHITSDGKESLSNRQLAYNVISNLPEDVRILGVRTRGLFGSVWSCARRQSAPHFVQTLIKSVFMWLFTAFRKKRKVSVHFEDLTSKGCEWALQERADFNRNLEEWYDSDLLKKGCECEPAT